jgi:hypothetical protein
MDEYFIYLFIYSKFIDPDRHLKRTVYNDKMINE